MTTTLEQKLEALEERVAFLEKERPGRKMKPNVVSQAGVCGINPDIDAETCPDASIYRYQQGCQGTKCVQINRDYYADYRAKKKALKEPSQIEVEVPAGASTTVTNGSFDPSAAKIDPGAQITPTAPASDVRIVPTVTPSAEALDEVDA